MRYEVKQLSSFCGRVNRRQQQGRFHWHQKPSLNHHSLDTDSSAPAELSGSQEISLLAALPPAQEQKIRKYIHVSLDRNILFLGCLTKLISLSKCPNSEKLSPSFHQSDQISHSVVSDSLRPRESQHARPPCPSPTPGVHSDSRPPSQ